MTQRIPITIRLDSFEGPLDLLLYLIQSHELDISKVSIARITDQYLAYVRLMQELNFDTASEFLVMAATLLHWKSRALLPQDDKKERGPGLGQDGDEFTQEDLIRQLQEHQRFLKAGETLGSMVLLGDDVFTRSNEKPEIQKIWKTMDISSLALSYQDILVRARKRTHVLRKETVSITDKIKEFADRLPLNQLMELAKLMSLAPDRPEIVATFLATLELCKLKKMRVHQEGVYSSIYVELLEALTDMELSLETEFEPHTPQNSDEPAPQSEATPA
ncbi:MAG: segregation/condensation protein A [Bdellovibrio sp.]|nr:segregation/condensation protein A [Bdellovibrio sp.]